MCLSEYYSSLKGKSDGRTARLMAAVNSALLKVADRINTSTDSEMVVSDLENFATRLLLAVGELRAEAERGKALDKIVSSLKFSEL